MERKIDEWEKSQNVSSEQTDITDPPPPKAHTKQVNAVFTVSGKSDDPPKIQKDPPPPIIVNNKVEKDNYIKTSKKGYHVVKTKEYPFQVVLDNHYETAATTEPVISPVHHGLMVEERLDEQSEVIGEMYEHLLHIPLPRIEEIEEELRNLQARVVPSKRENTSLSPGLGWQS
ncbi:hypothetical protein Tco_0754314 [Tanacetum coccineum]